MQIEPEYTWILRKKTLRKSKKRYTKLHKQRASLPLNLFLQIELEDTFTVCISNQQTSHYGT